MLALKMAEQRLQKAEAWVQKPKPKVDAQPPKDLQDEKDLIGRMNLLFDLVPLAFQTDSTRLITIMVQGRGDVVEHEVAADKVLDLVQVSPCSAYDCEFVALARQLGVKLVTMDGKVLRAFAGDALPLSTNPS